MYSLQSRADFFQFFFDCGTIGKKITNREIAMKKLLLTIVTATLLSTSTYAVTFENACVDANIKKEDLGLVMGILNKNGLSYRVVKDRSNGTYNVIAKARSGLGKNINSKLLNLESLEILKEEGIDFSRSTEGRCFNEGVDLAKL